MTRRPVAWTATRAGRERPHAGEPPAAQPLTDILLTPARPSSDRPSRPPVEAPPRSSSRSTASTGHGPRRLDDPRAPAGPQGIDTPTLCYAREPHAGQRLPRLRRRGHRLARPRAGLLAQGRARHGRPDRLRAGPAQSRKMVLEFLGSSVDLRSTAAAPTARSRLRRALRRGPGPLRAAGRAGGRRRARRARGGPPPRRRPATRAQTVAQPVKVDNDLYVRDYSKCILCYKCVEACGEDAQNTFAIAVAGRGFDARISTESAVPLPDSRRASTAATASASARPAR